MGDEIGDMTERLTVQRSDAAILAITSLTRAGSVVTATTVSDHGFATSDYVIVGGATPTGYNGKVKITVTGARTFTFLVSGTPGSPATFGGTVTYVSDAQGGRRTVWRTLATIWAELIPLKASERLQLQAIQSDVAYRFKVRTRADLGPTQRILWTPRWPPGSAAHALEINGVLPVDDGRTFQFLECAESSRVA
jgi:SPP1 family predicted phage head-tail adaptor